jgi:hypothetical protein
LSSALDHLSASLGRRASLPIQLASSSRIQGRKYPLLTLRRALALAGCAAGLLSSAPAAHAQEPAIDSPIEAETGQVLAETVYPETTAAGEATCSAPELFNPLTAFKDGRDYFVAPAGDFEDPGLPGWQLEGGASLTAGGSTHAVIGGTQNFSLSLPPGGSATSPEMCVDLNYPTFRFFATQLEQDTDAELAVDVIYPALARNNVRQAKKYRLKSKDGWQLTSDVKLEPQRLGKASGWRKIAIRFRVKPGNKPATYQIDDVLIDPRRYN